MKLGSLASGIGGLDIAVNAVFGSETIWHAEYDRWANEVYESHFDDPNLGDITKIDWSEVERPDILCGGYPCQPFSSAGLRRGFDDPRNLWPHFANAIRALRPSIVVLENVAAHLSMGFGRVLGDLAEIGFDSEWGVFRASDVGAPHRRERVFIVAYARGSSGWEVASRTHGDEGAHGTQDGNRPKNRTSTTPDAASHERRVFNRDGGQASSDSDGPGSEGSQWEESERWGLFGEAIQRWASCRGENAPEPLHRGKLRPEFVEWMMGYPIGWTEGQPRTLRLKMLGNAVVPQQGELAIRELLRGITMEEE